MTKTNGLSIDVMSAGKLFQRAGPSTRNALAPTVERWTGGTRRWLDDEERSDDRLGTLDSRVNGPRYSGALPWRTRWTRTANLNWIRSGVCNQCSDIRASETWSNRPGMHYNIWTKAHVNCFLNHFESIYLPCSAFCRCPLPLLHVATIQSYG